MTNENETFDITNDVIAFIVARYDEIGLTEIAPNQLRGYDKIHIAFQEIEKEGIRQLFDRMYKQFPYNANSKTARSTDASERKIRRLVNK